MARTSPIDTKLGKLQREARKSANFREHKLGSWQNYLRGGSTISNNACVICGAEIQVLVSPAANEIDIGGQAVALGCSQRRRRRAAIAKLRTSTGTPR